MPIKSEHEKRINAYIESNPTASTGRSHRLVIEGRVVDLEIFRLPIKFLFFNIENGRFAADLLTLEKELDRKLDTKNPQDAEMVKRILLDKSPADTKRLKEDLMSRGQLQPGIITAAGVVINANRRMAVLMDLYIETADDRYNWLEVVILPRNVSAIEIYKIEVREQYGEDYMADYPAINVLLGIKDGLDKGVPIKELAALLGKKEKEVVEHKNQLKLLEDYSKYAYGMIDYRKIEQEKITEIITEVEKNIRKFTNEGRRAPEIKKLLDTQFEYIKSGCTYRDLRAFGRSALHPAVVEAYFDAFAKVRKGTIDPAEFKERIDDVNTSGTGLNKKQQQNKVIEEIFRKIKIFQDQQVKITPEIRKNLTEISSIITKLLKK